MAKKIVINLALDEKRPVFRIGPLSLPALPKVEWHGMTPFKLDKQEFSVQAFRQLLSDEKARILHSIMANKPASIYELAKILKRDFKAVRQDIRLLEHFGLVRLVKEKSGKRQRMRPVLAEEKLEISFRTK